MGSVYSTYGATTFSKLQGFHSNSLKYEGLVEWVALSLRSFTRAKYHPIDTLDATVKRFAFRPQDLLMTGFEEPLVSLDCRQRGIVRKPCDKHNPHFQCQPYGNSRGHNVNLQTRFIHFRRHW